MASWWNQAIWMRYGCGSTNKYSIPNITKSGFSNSQEYAWLCLHQVVQKTWHFAHNNWGIISVNEPRFRISGAGVCQWSQKPLALRHIEIRDLPILQGDSKAWDPRKIQTSNPQNPKAFLRVSHRVRMAGTRCPETKDPTSQLEPSNAVAKMFFLSRWKKAFQLSTCKMI